MISNIISVILALTAIQLLGGDLAVFGASREEAQEALFALYDHAIASLQNCTTDIYQLDADTRAQIDAEDAATVQIITDTTMDIEAKISQILQNAQEVGVNTTRCTPRNQLETFRERLIERTHDCTNSSTQTVTNTLLRAIGDAQFATNNIVHCLSGQLSTCRENGDDAICYDELIKRVDEGWVKVGDLFAIRSIVQNQILGYKLPCRDLIHPSLTTYPNLLLQHVEDCVNLDIKLNTGNAC